MAALLTNAEILPWAVGTNTEGIDTAVVDQCAEAAQETVETLTGRRLSQASVTEVLDGSGPRVVGKQKEILLLDLGLAPFTQLTSVKENGVTLTLSDAAAGYDRTKQVVYSLAQGRLWRNRSQGPAGLTRIESEPEYGWAPGYQNLEVAFQHGYVDADALPVNLKLLISELAWLLYKTPGWVGLNTKGKRDTSFSLVKKLAEHHQELLKSMKVWGRVV